MPWWDHPFSIGRPGVPLDPEGPFGLFLGFTMKPTRDVKPKQQASDRKTLSLGPQST